MYKDIVLTYKRMIGSGSSSRFAIKRIADVNKCDNETIVEVLRENGIYVPGKDDHSFKDIVDKYYLELAERKREIEQEIDFLRDEHAKICTSMDTVEEAVMEIVKKKRGEPDEKKAEKN